MDKMYVAEIRVWGKDVRLMPEEGKRLMKRVYLNVYNKWADISEDVYKKINSDFMANDDEKNYLKYVSEKTKPFIDKCAGDAINVMKFFVDPETGSFMAQVEPFHIYIDVILKYID